MMNSSSSVTVCFLLLLLASLVAGSKRVMAEPTTLYVPTEYDTIQEAINAANNGDTVYVYNGTYQEWDINVTKSINLLGQNKTTTIIKGNNETVIWVLASNVNVSGFTIQEARCGIKLQGSNESCIENNIIITNTFDERDGRRNGGTGIDLAYSCKNMIRDNYLKNNFNGVKRKSSDKGLSFAFFQFP